MKNCGLFSLWFSWSLLSFSGCEASSIPMDPGMPAPGSIPYEPNSDGDPSLPTLAGGVSIGPNSPGEVTGNPSAVCGNSIQEGQEVCDSSQKDCKAVDPKFTGGIAKCNQSCDGYDSSSCTKNLVALIYKGPVACDGCETAIATMLKKCNMGWKVKYVGPNGELPISAVNLATADLYAQPGGDGGPTQAFKNPTQDISTIKEWVKAGGRYLGICLGGYYAGSWVFNMLPGDADSYVNSPGSDISTTADTIVKVLWRDKLRYIFFQDGAYFTLSSTTTPATILARYKANNAIAAMVTAFGKGKVAVSGPHPEGDGWIQNDPDGDDAEQGCDLVRTLMVTP